ncbi:unnamed protein product [Lupinus luteus]|uniref:Uncharacterized protein n=1 Tax=Lupinus luteus TaxID=3873 RepID=A0AAV1YQ91_LUPLU
MAKLDQKLEESKVENGKVVRGEKGYVSSSGLMFDTTRKGNEVGRSSFSIGIGHNVNETPRMTKTFSQKLMSGLKNAFRISNSTSN